ncbi:DUF6082 family protein [Streptomyces sp. NPDC058812]|uniref:DUF6082 family protein n=1 Tax=unclassified Streptomyces TaxID=2593676 RepID=UPI0036A64A24
MDEIATVVSLIISTISLAVVAAALRFQSRQMKISQDESMRAQHRELIGMSINDISLAQCWGDIASHESNERSRQLMFANLIFSWYYSSFITEDVNEAQLEVNLRTFFSGDVGKQYWDQGRSGWAGLLEAAESRRKSRFLAIADRAHESAESNSHDVGP